MLVLDQCVLHVSWHEEVHRPVFIVSVQFDYTVQPPCTVHQYWIVFFDVGHFMVCMLFACIFYAKILENQR